MEEDDESRWSNLTLEALVEIFRRLDLEDRYSVVPLVCKLWLKAAMEPACWERADMDDCFERRQESDEWWSAQFERKMDAMIKAVVDRSLGRLRELRTRHCSDIAVSYASLRCPALQCLSVKVSPSLTDKALFRIASNCVSLSYLDLSECRYITPFSLKNLAENCKSISVFKRNFRTVDDCRHSIFHASYLQIGDEEAIVLGTCMPNLTHLELRNSTISDIGLSSIVSGCKKLNHLDLYGCTLISKRGLNYASECLQHLKQFIRPHARILACSSMNRWQLYEEQFQNRPFQF